jgi:hypothetical protein
MTRNNADVTYGTNNEFGFDYLRDNMKFDIKDYCQRDFNFAIVDEVDSILIDEARTPLIISGPADISTELYPLSFPVRPIFQLSFTTRWIRLCPVSKMRNIIPWMKKQRLYH